jgi:hypothetical protein
MPNRGRIAELAAQIAREAHSADSDAVAAPMEQRAPREPMALRESRRHARTDFVCRVCHLAARHRGWGDRKATVWAARSAVRRQGSAVHDLRRAAVLAPDRVAARGLGLDLDPAAVAALNLSAAGKCPAADWKAAHCRGSPAAVLACRRLDDSEWRADRPDAGDKPDAPEAAATDMGDHPTRADSRGSQDARCTRFD